jgi:hypothetical protein
MGNSNSRQNSNQNSSQNSGIQQILFGLALVVALYVSMLFVEIMYKYTNRLSMNRTVLLANTYNTDDKTKIISQNPTVSDSKIVNVSNNERTGIEFSYSFYLNVHPSTFRQEHGLLHIFHKGYSQQFPLLAPGVYMRSDTNTLRVYMNTYKTWNNYVEVDNFPVGKWVHTVIVCKENSLEVFINGNLSRKLSFDGFAPYQNYEDIICFSSRVIKINNKNVQSADPEGFDVFGTMKGNLSRLEYFSYALCYAEIQQLMNKGPSSKSDTGSNNTDIPPYLDDTWWSQG